MLLRKHELWRQLQSSFIFHSHSLWGLVADILFPAGNGEGKWLGNEQKATEIQATKSNTWESPERFHKHSDNSLQNEMS